MRQRNVKNKEYLIKNSVYIINNPKSYKGNWKEVFNNNNPIHLEIGTGKCKFLVENAKIYPNINFIGLEKSDSVLALGLKDLKEDIPNLKLINCDANSISEIFNQEISLIYLNFSDPWPKKRHDKRRLTHELFLKEYDKIFTSTKQIIQKTDNQGLFEFSLVSFSNHGYIIDTLSIDLHKSEISDNIMTEYEDKFSKKGERIYLVKVIKN